MSARVKVLAWYTAIWMLFLSILCVFWYDLNGPFNLSGLMLSGVCLIAGALLSFFWLLAIREERTWLSQAIALSLIGFLVCAFLTSAEKVGRYAKFYLNKRSYESRVAEIIQFGQSKSGSDTSDQTKDYYIDSGPPVRVAFVWGGVFKWYGVVYDPTGKVLEATKPEVSWSSWSDPSLTSIKSYSAAIWLALSI